MVTKWWLNAFNMDSLYQWPIKSAAFKTTWIFILQLLRDFSCPLIQMSYKGMQKGQKLMWKYSATLLDKAMLCWLSEVSMSFKGRFNQALCILRIQLFKFISIPLEFSDYSSSPALGWWLMLQLMCQESCLLVKTYYKSIKQQKS